MVWSRPPGDPRVWSIVETVKADGKKVKFIIQEIPPNRYAEALDHLCTVFISSEPACRSIKLIDDAESVAEIRAFWTTALNHGISIGVYEADENNQISKFAGMNVLVMGHKDEDKTITPIKSTMSRAEKLITFMRNLTAEVDFSKRWGVDYYLSAAGLDVDTNYRRLGLGTHLLLAREKIAQAYNISVTFTFFSSPASQKTAEKAGLRGFFEKRWNDIVDDKGNIVFPGLGDTYCKVMEKKFE
ncbi:GSCOCG00010240001-RA-CDS [Cotesia congregata]|nr:GSCOCG00010240001-RA-CDS [Cotesia congregata]